ncbi:MAG: hypothetical protein AAFZ07_05090 [Actinomycetota bacterium]
MGTEEGRRIEWVASDDAATSSAVIDRRGATRSRWAPVGLAAIALAALAVLAGRTTDDPLADAEPVATTTTTTEAPAGGAEPSPPTVSTDTALSAAAVTDLGAVAALGVPLELIVTSPTSDEARLVSIGDDREISVVALPRLSDLTFDASGNWLAGVSYSRHGEQRRILWVGRVGEGLEPVAVGFRSFAWHDTSPGVVAWVDSGSRTVTSLALGAEASPRRTELPAGGLLKGWGDWGYALQSSPRTRTTTIVDEQGRLVVLDQPGRFAAHLPGRGVVISGASGGPVIVDEDRGTVRAIEGLEADEIVWSATTSALGEHLLVVDGSQRTAGAGTLVSLARDGVDDLATTPAVTDLAVTPEGDRIVLVNQAVPDGSEPGTIAVLADGEVVEAPVPDFFRGREWVTAISGRRGGVAG